MKDHMDNLITFLGFIRCLQDQVQYYVSVVVVQGCYDLRIKSSLTQMKSLWALISEHRKANQHIRIGA